jgi:hypothetical protein
MAVSVLDERRSTPRKYLIVDVARFRLVAWHNDGAIGISQRSLRVSARNKPKRSPGRNPSSVRPPLSSLAGTQ